jgi:pyruvate,water dikinase
MVKYVMYFEEIDKASLPEVGGKGASLGEMTKAGFPVPDGFCVTTFAYRKFIRSCKEMDELIDLLEGVRHDDLERVHALGESVRKCIRSHQMPDDIRESILEAWKRMGGDKAYAVRSSATAEDLPTASFAGQQETYLNVRGGERLLRAIQDCWASLFTDRAISYRARSGFGHGPVYISVVVQEMVFPEVSGIIFTADPITGRRRTASIDASFGLGEALVSGLVTADHYKVRSGVIIEKRISKKTVAIYPVPEGGTIKKGVLPEKQEVQALPDDRIVELATLGEKIEAHYGSEQDIEWCLADGELYILQSRPITTLYPVPRIEGGGLHVLISFGHVQMMMDAMRPLAISVLRSFLKFATPALGGDVLVEAGGRLFIDPTPALALKPAQHVAPRILGVMFDERMADSLRAVFDRPDFGSAERMKVGAVLKAAPVILAGIGRAIFITLFADPFRKRQELVSSVGPWWRDREEDISSVSGPERIRRIRAGLEKLLPTLFPIVFPYLIAAIPSSRIIHGMLKGQYGDKQGPHMFSRINKSLPGNVTTEMGLAVGDLADTARKYPEVVEYLRKAEDGTFYAGLLRVDGGVEFKQALDQFMDKYGVRSPGEIDITNPRWKDSPTLLVPPILSHIQSVGPGEHRERFKRGEADAELATAEILAELRNARFGFFKVKAMSRLLYVYRNLMGLREYPKYLIMQHFYVYRRGLIEEAGSLVEKGVLKQEQDAFYLSLDELLALEEGRFSGSVPELVASRKKQLEEYRKLTPPRVMTSEGEAIMGKRRLTGMPEGAIIGTPASAGIVEGIARVVLKPEDADLKPGEILVAPYTDPGWTPLFNSVKGLVTEVGGMMTHGSVIAREYGIPAVVGADNATKAIKSGARIRVNGNEGFVQILD